MTERRRSSLVTYPTILIYHHMHRTVRSRLSDPIILLQIQLDRLHVSSRRSSALGPSLLLPSGPGHNFEILHSWQRQLHGAFPKSEVL